MGDPGGNMREDLALIGVPCLLNMLSNPSFQFLFLLARKQIQVYDLVFEDFNHDVCIIFFFLQKNNNFGLIFL